MDGLYVLPTKCSVRRSWHRLHGQRQTAFSAHPALHDAIQRKIEDVEVAQVTATGSLDVCGRERMGQQERHTLLG